MKGGEDLPGTSEKEHRSMGGSGGYSHYKLCEQAFTTHFPIGTDDGFFVINPRISSDEKHFLSDDDQLIDM